jgi:GT2 family glycosyltransferase/glycosyltransferase involved in cell wall biosynthesis
VERFIHKIAPLISTRLSQNSIIYRILLSFYRSYRNRRRILPEETRIETSVNSDYFHSQETPTDTSNADNQIEFFQSDKPIGPIFGKTLTIFVPVFNRFDFAKSLIESLSFEIDHLTTKHKVFVNVVINDDDSAERTYGPLTDLTKEMCFTLTRSRINMGWLDSVNSFWENSSSDFVLLLNTDVVLAKGTVLKMFEVFVTNEKIGLVSVPKYSDVISATQSEASFNIISKVTEISQGVAWIDCCTAVGHALMIRRSSVAEGKLFDAEFGKGYGEESDLHYRVLDNGYKSVLCLNTVVSHAGGASFNTTTTAEMERMQGSKVFMDRWGERYLNEIRNFREATKNALNEVFSFSMQKNAVDVLIVAAGMNEAVGGLRVASDIGAEFVRQGKSVALYDPFGIPEKESYQDLFTSVPKIPSRQYMVDSTVLLAGYNVLSWWSTDNLRFRGSNVKYLLQGSDDLLIPPNLDSAALERYSSLDFETYVPSDSMEDYANSLGVKVAGRFTPSLSEAYFGGNSSDEKKYDVVFVLRENPGKGNFLAIPMVNILSERYRVAVVGQEDRFQLSKKVIQLGKRNRPELMRIFREAKVYVDNTLHEGFGLVTREAAFCGCHVFCNVNTGGLDDLVSFPNHFSFFPNIWNVRENLENIGSKINSGNCRGCEFCKPADVPKLGVRLHKEFY